MLLSRYFDFLLEVCCILNGVFSFNQNTFFMERPALSLKIIRLA